MLRFEIAFAAGLRENSVIAMLTINQAETAPQIDEVRRLFREYETALDLDLCFQGFEAELAELPGRYAPPDGRLLLAYADAKIVGCIALRKIDEGICEMKRLYVRDEARGLGIGLALIERIIDEARGQGYSAMRLDTSTVKMAKAIKLYESHGFRRIEAYYNNPHTDVIYMELVL